MSQFFNPYLTYNARIDSSFEGTFTMTFDVNIPYTHKSQYLLNATLTGSNDSNLIGNEQDNQLSGNSGDNILDGQAGNDTAKYSKVKSSYTINKNTDGSISVVGEGNDTLENIESIQFSDQALATENL